MSGRFTVLGLGEMLWDMFEDSKVPGGAPCNFAYHINEVGHRGIPLSRAGEDRLGDEIIAAVEDLGMDSTYIQRDPEWPTGTVIVKLDEQGTPDFTIVECVAWDCIEPDDRWCDLASGADAVCFGTLAQRSEASRRAIQQVLAAAEGALIVCDINFRQHYYSHEVVTESLALADLLKLNEEEVKLLGELLEAGRGVEEGDFLRGLMADYGLRMVCVTLGSEGCRLVTREESLARPVPPTEVVDTVGSGDAFTAGLVVKLLEGASLQAVADAANLLGGFVAGRRGATPRLDAEVLERFQAL